MGAVQVQCSAREHAATGYRVFSLGRKHGSATEAHVVYHSRRTMTFKRQRQGRSQETQVPMCCSHASWVESMTKHAKLECRFTTRMRRLVFQLQGVLHGLTIWHFQCVQQPNRWSTRQFICFPSFKMRCWSMVRFWQVVLGKQQQFLHFMEKVLQKRVKILSGQLVVVYISCRNMWAAWQYTCGSSWQALGRAHHKGW